MLVFHTTDRIICGDIVNKIMKIHQLFTKKVDTDVLLKLLAAFGINDLNDKKMFCKLDLVQHDTVRKIINLKSCLEQYYLPCKSKIYLNINAINEKRCVTILKQILRLHGYFLISKEKNLNNKKVVFYQLINEKERQQTFNMKRFEVTNIITFD